MSILSPENTFAERILFLGLVVGEDVEYVLNFLPIVVPKGRINLVFYVLLLKIA